MEVKFKNFCNRHIMLELPTIKTDFSSRTHRISIRLHMQDHNIPLFWLILSVYILTVFVLWNMFSKGHVTVMSYLFPRYDPSGGGKSAYAHFGLQTILLFSLFHIQNGVWRWFGTLKWVSISYVISLATSFKILSNSFDTSLRQHLL